MFIILVLTFLLVFSEALIYLTLLHLYNIFFSFLLLYVVHTPESESEEGRYLKYV